MIAGMGTAAAEEQRARWEPEPEEETRWSSE
jgi:hypothetical protein